jgi:hypothetical protein
MHRGPRPPTGKALSPCLAEAILRPDPRRVLLATALVVLFCRGTVSDTSAMPVATGERATSLVAEVHDPNPNITYERLLELLDLLHYLLNQIVPETTPASAESWFSLITARYNAYGVPANLTAAERAQGRAWIVEIKSCMQSIPQLLNPQAAASFNQTLDQIYADLGG